MCKNREDLCRYIISGNIVEITHSPVRPSQERGEWHKPREAHKPLFTQQWVNSGCGWS